jgi:hypothetical protein
MVALVLLMFLPYAMYVGWNIREVKTCKNSTCYITCNLGTRKQHRHPMNVNSGAPLTLLEVPVMSVFYITTVKWDMIYLMKIGYYHSSVDDSLTPP